MYTSINKSENDCLLDSVAGHALSGKTKQPETSYILSSIFNSDAQTKQKEKDEGKKWVMWTIN